MSRDLAHLHAVPRGLVALCLVLVASACGPARPSARSPSGGAGSQDAQQLAEAVARLRLERRQRERKIRDLEHQLAARGSSSESDVPALRVQVLGPTPTRADRADPSHRADRSELDDSALPPALRESSGLGRGSEAELPGELTAEGERVIGLADDGSEIVYIDDAATGRVVAPSAEVLAEVERAQRRAAAAPRQGSRDVGPELDEGDARALLDEAAADRLSSSPASSPAPSPAPLASLGRRAARSRAVPARPAVLPPSPPPSPPQPGVRGGDAETHYRSAIAMVRRAEYPAAIASLREFLQRHPRHDYADNAQYWLGEAFYAQRQYDKALAELRRVVELYPQGNKVPDALLKVGYCHLAMGDREKSTAILRELVRLFPRSEPALLAGRKLEEGGK